MARSSPRDSVTHRSAQLATEIMDGRLPGERALFLLLHAVATAAARSDRDALELAVKLLDALQDGLPEGARWEAWRGRLRATHMLTWLLARSVQDAELAHPLRGS